MGRLAVGWLVVGLLSGCAGQTVGDVSAAGAVQTLRAEVLRICGKPLELDLAEAIAANVSPLRGNLIRAARQLCPQLPGGR